jgi:hypothetical protein
VQPGGTVTVTVSGSDGGKHDWVGLFAVGASNFSNPILWEYLNGTQTVPSSGVTSATLTFVLPSNLAPGQYVFNLEFDNGVNSYTLGASSNTVTVTSSGVVNGSCGSANGVPTSTAPTTNLCSAGTASAVSGSGPWSWSCAGSNGGTTAQCSAPLSGAIVVARAITHLYNNQRTGWNSNETTLTTSNVNSSSFGLLNSVAVDEQVDAQPLVVTYNGVDQVFVATENNTVYRIAAASGAILQSRNLGTPVPQSSLPGSCNNNSAVVGINSTPVIDVSTQTIYVMTYTVESGSPVYRIHALDLETLADKVGSGVVVSASGRLSNGSTYTFNPAVSRQRSALLEANGNIYAGFASFCDVANNLSRGWMLGWQAGNLTRLAANELTNQLATSTNTFFLTSVWMSGAGPAADENGNVFFATGNSDYSGTSYDAVLNLSESVIEMSADLSTVIGAFTPTQSPDDQPTLDASDDDFGSGGVLLVPNQPSLPIHNLALAVGKAGYYYLLDRSATFAGATNTNKISQRLNGNGISSTVNGCWCATTYFAGSDGVPRIVAGIQDFLATFKLQASGSNVVMNSENQNTLSTGQSGGFFTSVSSNGTTAGSAVIWAVTRPTLVNINLVAFDNANNRIIYTSSSSHAGTWPNSGGNANLVPVVANGRVFVGSYKNLAIFGLGGSP